MRVFAHFITVIKAEVDLVETCRTIYAFQREHGRLPYHKAVYIFGVDAEAFLNADLYGIFEPRNGQVVC